MLKVSGSDPDELMRRAFPMHEAGNVAGAEQLYQQVLALAPDYADAHYLLGRIAQDRGELELALRRLQDAVRHNDRDPNFQKALGELHFNLGHFQDAAVHLQNAAELQPGDYEIWNRLGCAHERLGRLTEASRCFGRVVELQPNSPGAINNAAMALKDRGLVDAAIELFRKGMALAPDNLDLVSNYLYALNYSARLSAAERFAEHAKVDTLIGSARFAPMVSQTSDPDPERRLRIAYLSPDLRSHPVACFLEAPLIHRDRPRFEVVCYSLNTHDDAVTQRLKTLADQWIDCGAASDVQIAERIVQDRIDILVDLAGHTGNNRVGVLGRKPAPVIATWLGYPNTTGLKTVDYRLTDAVSDPVGATERYHSETLMRLPQQWCFSAPDIPARVTPLPALVTGKVTFGCFNHASKLNEGAQRAWARVLQRVEGSTLLIWGVEDEHAARIRHVMGEAGVDPSRLSFSARTSLPRQLELYQQVDIAFDSFPFGGVTTTFNSLWMGIPIVTLAGHVSTERASHAILSGLGLADWTAESVDEYVEIAVRKARDVAALAALRMRLRDTLSKSAFMDGAGFTRRLEQAYRSMWHAHCATARERPVGLVQDHRHHSEKADPDELMRRAFPMHEAGNVAGAEQLYHQILALAPDYADAHYLLGRIAQDRGQIELAIQRIREAVRHRDTDPAFHRTLGELHYGIGHLEEAMVYLGNAAALLPGDHEIWNNLAVVCEQLGLKELAAAHFARARDTKDNSPLGLGQLAQWLRDRGRADEALAIVDRMRKKMPDDPELFSGYLYHLHYLSPGISREQRFEEHLAFDATFGSKRFAPVGRKEPERDPERRLRIGYFSPDFRSHPVACFLEGPLAHHDHQAFEVYCYFLRPYGDVLTDQFRKMADHWIECRGMTDQQLAERIANDRIDILIDVAGHTGGGRPAVLGRKPAPVIATWLGYPDTTGLRTVDYRITDPVSDPEGMTERFHTETLLRLPHQWCFAAPYAETDVTPLPALRNGFVRFGSFNNAAKMTDAMVARWADVLAQLPASQILFWGIQEEHAARIRQIFREHGVEADRLEFTPRSALPKQLLLYQNIDIAFDTFPYHGTTTTFNSLWMGVPVVNLVGNDSVSRATHAIQSGLGLADWGAANADEYVALAVRKARDTAALAALRARLRASLRASPFMDAPAMAKSLEAAYRSMWRSYVGARGPS